MFSLTQIIQTLAHFSYQQKLRRTRSQINYNKTNHIVLQFLTKFNLILGFSKKKNYLIIFYNVHFLNSLLKNLKIFSKPKTLVYLSNQNLTQLVKENPFSLILVLSNGKLIDAKTLLQTKNSGILIAIFYF
jgi:hypothetical protein